AGADPVFGLFVFVHLLIRDRPAAPKFWAGSFPTRFAAVASAIRYEYRPDEARSASGDQPALPASRFSFALPLGSSALRSPREQRVAGRRVGPISPHVMPLILSRIDANHNSGRSRPFI